MEIFKLFGSIFVNTDDAEKSLSNTDKKVGGFATSLGKGITAAVKWGAGIATAAAGMAAAVGGAFVKIADETREYRTEMGKLETAFTTAGHTSEQAKDTYKALQSVLGETDTSVEAANHLAKLCDSQEDLNKWTEICTGVFATFGDSLPIEGLTEAANETAKVGQVTGPLADALNWAGISEDAFNKSLAKCTTEQERQALITDTLNGLYSEASQKYKEVNKDVMDANAANEKITSTMAKFGAIAEPVVTAVKVKFAEFLETLVPVVDKVADFVTKLANGEVNVKGFGEKLLSMFSPEFVETIKWFTETAFPNMIQNFKDSAMENFGGKLSGLKDIFNQVREIIQPFVEVHLVELGNAFLIVMDVINVIAIPALGFLVDAFMQITRVVLESVKPAILSIIDSFSSLYLTINEAISDYIIPTIEMFIQMIEKLWNENQDKINLIGNLFQEVFNLIAKKVEWFVGIVEGYIYPLLIWIINNIQDNKGKISSAIQQIIDGITSIIEIGLNTIRTVVEKGAGAFETIITAIQKTTEWCNENQTALQLLGVAFGTITALMIAYNAASIAAAITSGIETAAIYVMLAADGAAAIAKGGLTLATTLWTTVAGVATGVTSALGAAIAFLTSPIGLVILAIGAIIAIGVLLYQNWDLVKEKAAELGEKISEVFENIKNAINEKVEAAKTAVNEKYNEMKESMGNIMQAAKDTIEEKLNNIKSAYESHGGGVKGVAAAFMEGVKGYYSAGYTFIDNMTGGKLSEVANKFRDKLDIAKGYVSDKMGAIKDKFSSIISEAADKINSGIEKIKSYFNFSWSLPKLKLPHINISGSFSLMPPSTPSFDVEWYKNGGVMTQPTAFGMNPITGKVMAGGEAGAEAIAPITVLQDYIREAVGGQNQDLETILNQILQAIYALGSSIGLLNNLQVVLESGALVGEIAPLIDSELGTIIDWKGRNG